MNEADTPTLDDRAIARLCPVCGQHTTAIFCSADGAQTVVLGPPERDALSYRSGELVNDRYRITGLLGRGGFGAVYAAQHTGTQQALALKMLTARAEELSHSAVKRFFREARITARLTDPHTVRVFDVGQARGGPLFIAMELLRGPTLETLLRALEELGTPMTAIEAIDVATPVLRSLAEAHANELVHRDLKPSNVVLARVGDGETTVKVLDFGVARTADSSLTAKGSTVGTPAYMSPEQVQAEALDGRSDLYSLGVILFRCLVGRLPFESQDAFAMALLRVQRDAPDVLDATEGRLDPELAACLGRVLSRDRDARPADARTLRKELEAIRERLIANADVASDELPLPELVAAAGIAGPEDHTAESSPVRDAAYRDKLLRRSSTPAANRFRNSTPPLDGDSIAGLLARAGPQLDSTPSDVRQLLNQATLSDEFDAASPAEQATPVAEPASTTTKQGTNVAESGPQTTSRNWSVPLLVLGAALGLAAAVFALRQPSRHHETSSRAQHTVSTVAAPQPAPAPAPAPIVDEARREAATLVKEAVTAEGRSRKIELLTRALRLDPDNIGYRAMLDAARKQPRKPPAQTAPTPVASTLDAGSTESADTGEASPAKPRPRRKHRPKVAKPAAGASTASAKPTNGAETKPSDEKPAPTAEKPAKPAVLDW